MMFARIFKMNNVIGNKPGKVLVATLLFILFFFMTELKLANAIFSTGSTKIFFLIHRICIIFQRGIYTYDYMDRIVYLGSVPFPC